MGGGNMENKEPYGWETQLDLYVCDLSTIQSEEKLIEFAHQLVSVIDMKIYGTPVAPYFGTNCEKTAGRSLFTFLETSNLCVHLSDFRKSAHLTLFSCKPYDPEAVRDFSMKFFEAKDCTLRFVERF
jgi:S-adenosylmethionine/arginine decarboxylase-like enzyme